MYITSTVSLFIEILDHIMNNFLTFARGTLIPKTLYSSKIEVLSILNVEGRRGADNLHPAFQHHLATMLVELAFTLEIFLTIPKSYSLIPIIRLTLDLGNLKCGLFLVNSRSHSNAS